jgi:hypothetical protein
MDTRYDIPVYEDSSFGPIILVPNSVLNFFRHNGVARYQLAVVIDLADVRTPHKQLIMYQKALALTAQAPLTFIDYKLALRSCKRALFTASKHVLENRSLSHFIQHLETVDAHIFRKHCVSLIEDAFKTAISNPNYALCRKRLMNEFTSLCGETA